MDLSKIEDIIDVTKLSKKYVSQFQIGKMTEEDILRVIASRDFWLGYAKFKKSSNDTLKEKVKELEAIIAKQNAAKNKPKNAPKNKPKNVPAPISNPRRTHDQKHLASYEKRLDFIRDDIAALISGKVTGMYLSGNTGTGKTYTVKEEFETNCPGEWEYIRGGITPQGVFTQVLENDLHHKNRHVIIDDVYGMLKSDKIRGYLLGLLEKTNELDSEGRMVRRVSYITGNDRMDIAFSKSIVMLSNEPIKAHDNKVLAAIRGRVLPKELSPTNAELFALIYTIAEGKKGGEEVVDWLYDIFPEYTVELTIRIWEDAYNYKHQKSRVPWKERVRELLRQLSSTPVRTMTMAEKKANTEKDVLAAWKSSNVGKERLEEWKRLRENKKPDDRSTFYEYAKLLGLTREK